MAIRTESVYMRRAHEEKVTRLTLGELPLQPIWQVSSRGGIWDGMQSAEAIEIAAQR